MIFNFRGGLVGGKNMIQTAYVGGRKIRYPTANFKRWREDFGNQLWGQKLGFKLPVEVPVWFKVDYHPHDRRSRDIPGMMDALFHLMEHCHVVADDKLFRQCRGWMEHEPTVGGGMVIFQMGEL